MLLHSYGEMVINKILISCTAYDFPIFKNKLLLIINYISSYISDKEIHV